jgi:hypothetical protein
MALCVSVIVLAQFLLHGYADIFPGLTLELRENLIGERMGHLRIGIGASVVAPAGVLAFVRFVQSKSKIYLLPVILLLLHVALITQTRALLAGMLLSMFIIYLLARKITLTRSFIFFLLLILIIPMVKVISTDVFEQVSLVKLTKTEIQNKSGSYGARLQTYGYYWKEITKSPIIGSGFIDYSWEGSLERRLRANGIHSTDIGIVQFIAATGFIGFMWIITGFFILWKDIIHYRSMLLFSSYFILATITMPTIDLFMRTDTIFLFSVFLALQSNIIQTTRTSVNS